MNDGETMEHEWGMNLVIDVELHMALKCSEESRAKGEEYACNCESPFDWSLEKLLDYAKKNIRFADYNGWPLYWATLEEDD
jgi:hypothetical protein